MASTINASTSSGIVQTADTSGVLQLQTASTTAVTVDASQNVGIGITPYATGMVLYRNTTGLLYNDIQNPSAVNSSDGAITRLITQNVTSSGTVSVDMVKYKSGQFTINNNETNAAAFTSFGVGASERMRIDSSGNVLVATTNAAENAGPGIKLAYSTTDPTVRVVANSATSGNSGYILYNTNATNNGYRFYVTYSGVVNAVTTTIAGISDQRFKENIKDLDDGLDAVLALKPRKFDWKEGKGANTKNARGFIAQEFETVFPDLVNEWLEPAPEGEEPYKSVRADLIPTLVKAIQEQQTIINDLKARITALEGAK